MDWLMIERGSLRGLTGYYPGIWLQELATIANDVGVVNTTQLHHHHHHKFLLTER
jgi:hypothetical protein